MDKLVSGNPQDSLSRFIGELLSDFTLEDANRALTTILNIIIIQTNQLLYATAAIILENVQWNKLCTDVTSTVIFPPLLSFRFRIIRATYICCFDLRISKVFSQMLDL